MTTDPITDVIRLVLGVARLGENDLRGWWKGHAMDATGQYVLSGLFPRTWRAAGLELDVMAATRMHDEVLGRSSALHLFSSFLPFGRWATGWLAEQKTAPQVDPLLSTLEGWSKDDAAEGLRHWCGGVEPQTGEVLGDGLFLGRLTASEIGDNGTLHLAARRLATAYLQQTGSLHPPYFDLAR
ncbi:MAG: BrxE family protein [Gaiella sp.]